MTDKNNILLMIPDYLEGRLSAQDRLIVETSIDQDAEFAAEFEFQKNIKAALLANIDINVSDELGWARLKKEISVPQFKEIPLPQQVNDNFGGGKIWRYAAAILMVAVIGQAAFIGTKLQSGNSDKYLTADDTASQNYRLKVGFGDKATLADVTELMKETNGHVMAGPSSLGLYVIRFSSEAELLAAEATFDNRSDLIDTQGRP